MEHKLKIKKNTRYSTNWYVNIYSTQSDMNEWNIYSTHSDMNEWNIYSTWMSGIFIPLIPLIHFIFNYD